MRTGLRFTRMAKVSLYGSVLLSLLSGSTWFILHTWFVTEGDFGPEHSPWEPQLMKVHGAAAFIAMLGFGWLLGRHVPMAWRTRRHRISGLALVTAVYLLILSGYGLYYIGDLDYREKVGLAHLSLGLLLPLLLLGHIIQAHKSRLR